MAPLELQLIERGGAWTALGFTLSERGLESAEETATVENATKLIVFFQRIDKITQVIIGDMLNWIERERGITYKQVAKQTGYTVETLYNASSIMAKVPLENRIVGLSFADYTAVAHIENKQLQARWLKQRAETMRSARQLSATIYGSDHPNSTDGETIGYCPQCNAQLQIADNRIVGILTQEGNE